MKIPAKSKPFWMLLGVTALLGQSLLIPAHALRLSDLVKQKPEIYLPSQIIPGHSAVFTIKARPGSHIELFLSAQPNGKTFPSGLALRVGTPVVDQKAVMPAAGVMDLSVKIPGTSDQYEDEEYVEAVVWTKPDQSDAQLATIINHSGEQTANNIIDVNDEPEHGKMLVVPGDSSMTSVLRSLNTLNDVSDDPRKRQLLDTGDINRGRQIDRALNNIPTSH